MLYNNYDIQGKVGLIIGADLIKDFHKWKEPEKIAEISDIDIPLWTILVFVIVPATELYIYFKTDIDAELFLFADLIFLALWLASLAAIGCIENKLKLGLSGTEAFVISLGMPVAFAMIITVIAFTVIGVSKIATKWHKDR